MIKEKKSEGDFSNFSQYLHKYVGKLKKEEVKCGEERKRGEEESGGGGGADSQGIDR